LIPSATSWQIQQTELRALFMKAVEILSEDRWQPDWHHEPRLALLFEPSIREVDPWGGELIEQFWLPHWPNRLDLVSQAADFCADADKSRSNALDGIIIERLGEGSAFDLCEINEARELWGGAYSTHTPVFVSVRLASITFDHLRERLQFALLEKPKGDRVLLACGFMAGDIAIPRPRPVKRDQKLPNAISIYRKTPRTWFEIVRATENESHQGPLEVKSLERWMAIER
jgi:hypothetical protein